MEKSGQGLIRVKFVLLSRRYYKIRISRYCRQSPTLTLPMGGDRLQKAKLGTIC